MKNYVDLLPQNHHRWGLIRRRLMQWSAALAAVAVVVGVVTVIERNQLHKQLAQRNVLESQYLPIVKLESEVKSNESKVRELEQREAMTLQLADEHSMLTVLGIVSRAARKCEGTVAVTRLTVIEKIDPAVMAAANVTNAASVANGATPSAPAPPSPQKILTLQGLGLDNLSVVRLVASISEEDAFERVELKASGSQTDDKDGKSSTLRYLIECAY